MTFYGYWDVAAKMGVIPLNSLTNDKLQTL